MDTGSSVDADTKLGVEQNAQANDLDEDDVIVPETRKPKYHICGYLAFVIVFTLATWLQRGDENAFYAVNRLKSELLEQTYPNIHQNDQPFESTRLIEDIWRWLQSPAIRTAFQPFQDSLADCSDPVNNVTYGNALYNNWNPTGNPNSWDTTINCTTLPSFSYPSITNPRPVNLAFTLLGGMRIRQLRIKPGSCAVPSRYVGYIKECNPKYSRGDADTGVHPALTTAPLNYPGRTWTDEVTNGEAYFQGKLNLYDGSGYVVDLTDFHTAFDTLTDLRAARWIDQYTRAVFIDVNSYNPAVNLHLAGRMLFELSPMGGIWPKADFTAIKLNRYTGVSGGFQAFLELVVLLCVLYFTVFLLLRCCPKVKHPALATTCYGCKKPPQPDRAAASPTAPSPSAPASSDLASTGSGSVPTTTASSAASTEPVGEPRRICCSHFRSFWSRGWNAVDGLSILCFFVAVGIRFAIFHKLAGNDPAANPMKFISLQLIITLHSGESFALSFCAFFVWIRIIALFSDVPGVRLLGDMFGKAAKSLVYFFILFILFFIGFAHAGYLAFSQDVSDFRSLEIAFVSLFQSIMGGMNVDELINSNRYFGVVYFIAWQVTIMIILINIFLAIMNDAYADTKEADSGSYDNKANLGLEELFTGVWSNTVGALLRKFTTKDVAKLSAADTNADGLTDVNELAEVLLEGKFCATKRQAREKAKTLIKAFDTNNDGGLDRAEMEKLQDELLMLAKTSKSRPGEIPSHRELKKRMERSELDRRLESIEQTLEHILEQYRLSDENADAVAIPLTSQTVPPSGLTINTYTTPLHVQPAPSSATN